MRTNISTNPQTSLTSRSNRRYDTFAHLFFNLPSFTPPVRATVGEVRYSIEISRELVLFVRCFLSSFSFAHALSHKQFAPYLFPRNSMERDPSGSNDPVQNKLNRYTNGDEEKSIKAGQVYIKRFFVCFRGAAIREILKERHECPYCRLELNWENFSYDRIDNEQGHVPDNTILTCSPCNDARKNGTTPLEFVKMCYELRKLRGLLGKGEEEPPTQSYPMTLYNVSTRHIEENPHIDYDGNELKWVKTGLNAAIKKIKERGMGEEYNKAVEIEKEMQVKIPVSTADTIRDDITTFTNHYEDMQQLNWPHELEKAEKKKAEEKAKKAEEKAKKTEEKAKNKAEKKKK